MLYLYPNSAKIIRAKRDFHSGMLDFIYGRIDKISTIKAVNTTKIEILFSMLINDNIDDILTGDPNRLLLLNQKINPIIQNIPDFKKAVHYVFDYKSFIVKREGNEYDAYKLAESLNISTCTYCNRNYTNTVIRSNKRKITRPQFDHYFDKANNPLLAISFYNLIPSCSICNSSVKGTAKMNLTDYLHPYLDNKIDDITFSYKYSHKTKSGLEIKVVTADPSKEKNTIETFAIEEVYNSHTGELLDMLKTKQYFSDKYLGILSSNLLKDVIVSKEDLYRIVFGTEYDSKNFVNRPFSKFKNDILKELGII